MPVLSNYDRHAPTVHPGDRLTLRSVLLWWPQAPVNGPRPIPCHYSDGAGMRTLYWSATLDGCLGVAFECVGYGPSGLPLVARLGQSSGWELHPDWLTRLSPAATPPPLPDAEPTCPCLSPSYHRKDCPWLAWWTPRKPIF